MMRRPVILMLKGYRAIISPYLPSACRYQPTCSQYAEEAVQKHGVLRGAALAARRLGRCQPAVEGGYDPVPDRN